jgi:hypothetical protein
MSSADNASMAVQGLGAVHQAVGAYYQAKSQRLSLRGQASALQYQQRMSQLNQRIVAREAIATFQEAQKMIGRAAMQHGAAQSQARAAFAARGGQAGVGSSAEVLASMRYAQEADAMAMNAQAVRQREAMMTQRVDIANQGMMAGVQASAVLSGARSILPGSAMIGSLLGSTGNMLAQWAYSQRFENQQQQGMAPLGNTRRGGPIISTGGQA